MKPEGAKEIMSEALYHTNNPVSAEAINLAIQALEKQVPKKPIMGEFGVYVCSDCECVVEEENDYGRWEDRFCPDCGQRIDWSVYE